MRATLRITNNPSLAGSIFRRLAFNVLSGNMDDHPKQHSFLYDGNEWSLSPAYDLTPSERTIGHSMAALGTANPTRSTLIEFAKEYDVRSPEAILDQVAEAVSLIPLQLEANAVPDAHRLPIQRGIESRLKAFKPPRRRMRA